MITDKNLPVIQLEIEKQLKKFYLSIFLVGAIGATIANIIWLLLMRI